MAGSSGEKPYPTASHRQRRHDAYERAAAAHERAANHHDKAADFFDVHNMPEERDQHHQAAAEQRRQAEAAHRAANEQ